jgi:hypothetical protein
VAASAVPPRCEAAHRRAGAARAPPASRYRRGACWRCLGTGRGFLGTAFVCVCRALAAAIIDALVAHYRAARGADAATVAAAGDGRAVRAPGGCQETGDRNCESGYSTGDGVASRAGEEAPGRRGRDSRGGGERVRLRGHQLRVGSDDA